jgi:hypothetical protein
MSEPIKVSILGGSYGVGMPDFAAREEMMIAFGDARNKRGTTLLRVYSAALGLCTRLGKESGASYQKSGFDVLNYGGEVYGWLRQQGVTPADIATAAIPVIIRVSEETFPRQDEVVEAVGNSEGGTDSES